MADVKTVLSVIATTGARLPDLAISDGQLIFVQDRHTIAFDFKGKRKFYNGIAELDRDVDRVELKSPMSGYYFVIETAVLWRYDGEWIALTTPPEDVIFIGVELPALGNPQTLYVDKSRQEISVWDKDEYLVVADKTHDIAVEDITALFA